MTDQWCHQHPHFSSLASLTKKGRKWRCKIIYHGLHFSPPALLGSTACRPPEPLWPMEAHLSSELTAQSEAQTRMGTFNLKLLIYWQRFKCWCLCRCVCLQRTSKLTWQLEPLEIWVKELLKARVRKINTQPEDCVKHLQSVLCTNGIVFHRNSSKSLKPVCVCVRVCTGRVFMSAVCRLTTVEHGFHIKTVWQEQIGLPFEGLKCRLKTLKKARVCLPDPTGSVSPHSPA